MRDYSHFDLRFRFAKTRLLNFGHLDLDIV